jgi:hypothetical protein
MLPKCGNIWVLVYYVDCTKMCISVASKVNSVKTKTVFQILLVEKIENANLDRRQVIACVTQSLATTADKKNRGTYEEIWWNLTLDFFQCTLFISERLSSYRTNIPA